MSYFVTYQTGLKRPELEYLFIRRNEIGNVVFSREQVEQVIGEGNTSFVERFFESHDLFQASVNSILKIFKNGDAKDIANAIIIEIFNRETLCKDLIPIYLEELSNNELPKDVLDYLKDIISEQKESKEKLIEYLKKYNVKTDRLL